MYVCMYVCMYVKGGLLALRPTRPTVLPLLAYPSVDPALFIKHRTLLMGTSW
jgi:hypothetical protein